MKRLVVIAGVVCIAMVAVAGCGGDDDAITKAEFTQQANAICAKASVKRLSALESATKKQRASGGKLDKAFGEELVIDVALPPLVQMTDELAELDNPEIGSDEAAAMIDAYQAGIEVIEANPARALDGPSEPFEEARKLADEFGLTACSRV